MKAKDLLGAVLVLVVVMCLWKLPLLNSGKLQPDLGEKEVSDFSEIQWNTFSLEKKAFIGIDKYGYRKKITFDEPVMVSQFVYLDHHLEQVYYGIYRDKQLTDPVFEVNLEAQVQAKAALDEGAELDQYPDYDHGYCPELEPGTYYAGLYTKKLFARGEVKFVSNYGPTNDVIALTEGEETPWYFIEKEPRQFYLEIKPEKSGTVKVEIANCPSYTEFTLCDKDKKRVKELERSLTFFADKGQIYYVQVNKTEDGPNMILTTVSSSSVNYVVIE